MWLSRQADDAFRRHLAMTSPLPHLRTAEAADIPAMEALIARSGVALSVGFYSPEQAEALTRHVFGVDTQLVADRTYFVIEDLAGIVACGGWSKRRTTSLGKTSAMPTLSRSGRPSPRPCTVSSISVPSAKISSA